MTSVYRYSSDNGTHFMDMDISQHILDQHANLTNASVSFKPTNNIIRPTILVVYLACFAFGLTGNILVIGIIAYYKNIRIKSVANYYIWNLAFADLLYILTIPFFCYITFTEDWPFGDATCKIAFAFRETNRFSSVFLLFTLSWDRFIASYYNLSHFRTIKLGTIICFIIWFICGLMSIPYWLYSGTIQKDDNLTACHFQWPANNKILSLTIWTYLQLTIGLLIPIVLIITAYVLLSRRLKNMMSGNNSVSQGIKKPSQKMTRTVIVVVATFFICQTPYYIVEVWSLIQQQHVHKYSLRGEVYRPTWLEIMSFPYVNAIAKMLVFISSSINPILYGLLNENYRKLYSSALCRCKEATRQSTQVKNDNNKSSDDSETVTYTFKVTFHHPFMRKKKARKINMLEGIEMTEPQNGCASPNHKMNFNIETSI